MTRPGRSAKLRTLVDRDNARAARGCPRSRLRGPHALGDGALAGPVLPGGRLPEVLADLLPRPRRLADADRAHLPARSAVHVEAALGAARRPLRRPAALDRRLPRRDGGPA